jgi:hypothetical protein
MLPEERPDGLDSRRLVYAGANLWSSERQPRSCTCATQAAAWAMIACIARPMAIGS